MYFGMPLEARKNIMIVNKYAIPAVLSFLLCVQSYSMLSMKNSHNGSSETAYSIGLLNKNLNRLQSMQNDRFHGGIDYDFHRPLHYGIIQAVEKFIKINPLFIELALRGAMLFLLFMLLNILSGKQMAIWAYPLFATMYGSGFVLVGTKDIMHTVGVLAVIWCIKNIKTLESVYAIWIFSVLWTSALFLNFLEKFPPNHSHIKYALSP